MNRRGFIFAGCDLLCILSCMLVVNFLASPSRPHNPHQYFPPLHPALPIIVLGIIVAGPCACALRWVLRQRVPRCHCYWLAAGSVYLGTVALQSIIRQAFRHTPDIVFPLSIVALLLIVLLPFACLVDWSSRHLLKDAAQDDRHEYVCVGGLAVVSVLLVAEYSHILGFL